MPNITVNDDLTSHVLSDDGTQEFLLPAYNVLTMKPFTSVAEVEAFIITNIDKYKWWQPYIDPVVKEEMRLAYLSEQVRQERAALLAATDWLALSDVTMSEAWATYRQALRDITTQEGFPASVDWPVKPNV